MAQEDASFSLGEAPIDELYRTHFPQLVRYARRFTVDLATAEDLAQDAFLHACRKLDRYDASRPFWPWLAAITKNLALDRLRCARNASREIEDGPSHSIELARVEQRAVVSSTLTKLSLRQRQALGLHYVIDLDTERSARTLGMSGQAFRQLLVRARARFRSEFRRLEDSALAALPLAGLRHLSSRLRALRTRAAGIPADALGALGTAFAVGIIAVGLTVVTPPSVSASAPDDPLGGTPTAEDVGSAKGDVIEHPRPRVGEQDSGSAAAEPVGTKSSVSRSGEQPGGVGGNGSMPGPIEAIDDRASQDQVRKAPDRAGTIVPIPDDVSACAGAVCVEILLPEEPPPAPIDPPTVEDVGHTP